jgi:hypothetical protein
MSEVRVTENVAPAGTSKHTLQYPSAAFEILEAGPCTPAIVAIIQLSPPVAWLKVPLIDTSSRTIAPVLLVYVLPSEYVDVLFVLTQLKPLPPFAAAITCPAAFTVILAPV